MRGPKVLVLQFGDRERATIAFIGFQTKSHAAAQGVTGSFGKRAVRGSRTTPLVVLRQWWIWSNRALSMRYGAGALIAEMGS